MLTLENSTETQVSMSESSISPEKQYMHINAYGSHKIWISALHSINFPLSVVSFLVEKLMEIF